MTTQEKIVSFLDYPTGWSFGEGQRVSNVVVEKALTLLNSWVAEGFHRHNAFLGLGGEIRVTFYINNVYIEYTIENDLCVTFDCCELDE